MNREEEIQVIQGKILVAEGDLAKYKDQRDALELEIKRIKSNSDTESEAIKAQIKEFTDFYKLAIAQVTATTNDLAELRRERNNLSKYLFLYIFYFFYLYLIILYFIYIQLQILVIAIPIQV